MIGTLSDQLITDLAKRGSITNAAAANPNSLDLHTTGEIFQLPAACVPRFGQTVRELLEVTGASKHPADAPLLRHTFYAIRLNEALSLPIGVFGSASSKSSTGRIDLHARLLTDSVATYDTIPTGYRGELWVLITPKSFHCLIPVGEPIIQLRLMGSDMRLDIPALQKLHSTHGILRDESGTTLSQGSADQLLDWEDRTYMLTLGAVSDSTVGFVARSTETILDLSKRNHYHAEYFYIPVPREAHRPIILKKGMFYLLITNESVVVPPGYACTMQPVKVRHAEIRAHYAGFIDEGWGMAQQGRGRRLVLEVRPFEDTLITLGQPIASIGYEVVPVPASTHYDAKETSHYTQQGMGNPLSILPKFFNRNT